MAPREHDRRMMERTLALARRGRGRVSPNPMVGAVLVRNGGIVAEGYHRKCGGDHAEIDALARVGFRAEGCEMYVNLEPCVHYGRTAPCVDAIIGAGPRMVHVAMIDPNPLVAGRGVEKLRKAGIGVEVGLLEDEARRLNEVFVKYITTKTPFVVAKAAVTLDGKIATRTGDSGRRDGGMSGPEARRYVHGLRRDLDAILVGGETVRLDNPRLTCRIGRNVRQPVRIVLDGRGVSPVDAAVFNSHEAPTVLATTRASEGAWRRAVAGRGAEVLLLPGPKGTIAPKRLLVELGRRQIASLLVEGGSLVLASFLEAGAIDRFDVIYTPRMVGGRGLPLIGGDGAAGLAESWSFSALVARRLGSDLLVQARPKDGWDQ